MRRFCFTDLFRRKWRLPAVRRNTFPDPVTLNFFAMDLRVLIMRKKEETKQLRETCKAFSIQKKHPHRNQYKKIPQANLRDSKKTRMKKPILISEEREENPRTVIGDNLFRKERIAAP